MSLVNTRAEHQTSKSRLLKLDMTLSPQTNTSGPKLRKLRLFVLSTHAVRFILTTMIFMMSFWCTTPRLTTRNLVDKQPRAFKVKEPDCDKPCPLFGWQDSKTIKKTFESTAQCARMPHGTILKKHCKSPFPALNVQRRDEPVATDTVRSDTPAIDGGETSAQTFVGTETLVTDARSMKSEKQFVNALEDDTHERDAMSRLLSDRAQVETKVPVLLVF